MTYYRLTDLRPPRAGAYHARQTLRRFRLHRHLKATMCRQIALTSRLSPNRRKVRLEDDKIVRVRFIPVKSKDNVTERELFFQKIMLLKGSRSFI